MNFLSGVWEWYWVTCWVCAPLVVWGFWDIFPKAWRNIARSKKPSNGAKAFALCSGAFFLLLAGPIIIVWTYVLGVKTDRC